MFPLLMVTGWLHEVQFTSEGSPAGPGPRGAFGTANGVEPGAETPDNVPVPVSENSSEYVTSRPVPVVPVMVSLICRLRVPEALLKIPVPPDTVTGMTGGGISLSA